MRKMLHLSNLEWYMLGQMAVGFLVIAGLWIQSKKHGQTYDRCFLGFGTFLFILQLAVVLLTLLYRGNHDDDGLVVIQFFFLTIGILVLVIVDIIKWEEDRETWPDGKYIGWLVSFGRVDQILNEPIQIPWWYRFGFYHYVYGFMIEEIQRTGKDGAKIWLKLVLKATPNIGPNDFQEVCYLIIGQCWKVAQEIVNSSGKNAEECLDEFLRDVDKRVDVEIQSPSLYLCSRVELHPQISTGI